MATCALGLGPTTDASSRGRLRVLFVIPASPCKDSMIFARRQVASLQRAGVVCECFFLESRTSPSTLLAEWRRLRMNVRKFQPDLVHAQYGTMTAFFTAIMTSLPLVVTYRGSDLNYQPTENRVRSFAGRMLSQIAALRATRIICVSDELRHRLWFGKHRAVVVPSGVDTQIFYPWPRNEARSELGWGTNDKVVLFNAGQNQKLKRLDLAQAAVDAAKNICGEIRFVVLNGEVAPDRIPVLMCAADCILLTSDSEGSPNVVKEAMACNLPVVSVEVGDVRLRLQNVRPSRITASDPQQLGSALAEVLSLGQRSNGSSQVHEISSGRVTERILSVYSAIVNRNVPLDLRAKSAARASDNLPIQRSGVGDR